METYEICVLGSGSGGYAAAMRAVDFGKKVCIIEGGEIGGAGVKWGALASKTMWELAKDFAIASKRDRGYHCDSLTVDYQTVRSTVIDAIHEKQDQMLCQIEAFAAKSKKGPGILTLKRGWGAFLSPETVIVRGARHETEEIHAQKFLIATGSKPRNFPDIEVDQKRILNSDGILNLKEFPKRFLIIGAGIVGCEYASIFSNFKQTKVYLIDHEKRILPYEDKDISDFVGANLTKNGVTILHSAKLTDLIEKDHHLEVVLATDNDEMTKIEVDVILFSIGRSPQLSKLKLKNANIEPDEDGYLSTDKNCCIKNNIYAAGDVTHYPNLVNIAELEGRNAVKHMLGLRPSPINYTNMATSMFFYPPVAAVGLNEKQCQQKKIPYRVGFYSNVLLSRAIAMRSLNGFVKIIVSDDKKQKILGMRSAGSQVTSTIMSIAMLLDQAKGLRDAVRPIYPHPTMSEGIQECLRLLLGESVYKPHAFPEFVKIRTWDPDKGYRL
ncbi:MAG: NAD(P)/FAD-dependent oxidoreductase [Deltaproteobacteria bacterium]|nr:NAD(P)/FAD-dependent oxidoreductase [Deltaproteobacteria bacterium]